MMKTVLLAGVMLIAGPALGQEKEGATPSEKVEKRLAELLQPGVGKAVPFAGKPIARGGLWWLENPQAPLPLFQGRPLRVAPAPLGGAKPDHLPESMPMVRYWAEPSAPFGVELPAGYLVRLPTVDVNQPTPLPILSVPSRDKAALADPTYESSVSAALARVEAIRLAMVPFKPVNLPDPFENSQAIRLRNPLDEDPSPALVTPRSPTK
jgi:hypothetical protein